MTCINSNSDNTHSSCERCQLDKHGINIAMSDHTSLVELLVAKGIFTEDEVMIALADGAETEVRRIESDLSQGSVKVTLYGAHGSIHDNESITS